MNRNQNNYGIIQPVGSGGFMNPEKIIEELGIKSGMIVADFGCGAGYFTIPIAKLVKNSGKVYAIDVLNSALDSVLSKSKLYNLLNIEIMRANVEVINGTGIKDNSIDFVILANVLFQCKNHDSVLSEAKRILKQNGRIVIVEWNPKKILGSMKFENYISENSAKKLSIRNGLKIIGKVNAGNRHYGIVLSKF